MQLAYTPSGDFLCRPELIGGCGFLPRTSTGARVRQGRSMSNVNLGEKHMLSIGSVIKAGYEHKPRDFNGNRVVESVAEAFSLTTISAKEFKDWKRKGKIPLEVLLYMWGLGIRVTKDEPWTPMFVNTFLAKLRAVLPHLDGHERLMAEVLYEAFVRGEMM